MGVLLACLASLSFVVLDVQRKLLGRRLPATDIVIGINIGAVPVFVALILVFGGWQWDRVFIGLAVLEAVTFYISSVLYVQAVRLSPLSLTIPYLAFTPAISALVASFLLGEIPSPSGLLGICLVGLGAFALHLDRAADLAQLLKAPIREPGSWRMLIVAVIWGVTTSVDKIAISHGSEPLLGLALTGGSALLLICYRLVGQKQGRPRESRHKPAMFHPLLYLAAIVAGIAVISQYLAYRELLVSYVETIKRAGGLLSAAAGGIFFNEVGLAGRLPAAALMVVGILLIVL
jgi:drug/metabolite transporter (DMT)-like permease